MRATALVGHKDSVVSVDSLSNLLLSVSEDSTARVWDLRTQKAVKLIKLPKDTDPGLGKFVEEYTVAIGASNKLLVFDIRANAVIIQEATDIFTFSDEINDFDVNDQRVVVPCDDGSVSVVDLANSAVASSTQLHENICGSARWVNGKVCISTGYDYKLIEWENTLQKKSASVQTFVLDRYDQTNMMVNPPFPTAMAVIKESHRSLALVGLGNGDVLGFDCSERVNLRKPRFNRTEVHASGIAAIAPVISPSIDRPMIWSAGNDMLLKLTSLFTKEPAVSGVKLLAKPNYIKPLDRVEIAVATMDSDVYIYNLASDFLVRKLNIHRST
jgi:WD40 repeat protein